MSAIETNTSNVLQQQSLINIYPYMIKSKQ